MNSQQQLQLEDAQKKLALFRKHLELIARCTGESKNIEKDEILSAVAELQTLVEWAAQQKDLGAVSTILLVKLQELNQIRENLEKSSSVADKTSIPEEIDDSYSVKSHATECLEKHNSHSIIPDLGNNYEENDIEEESVSLDKDSLCDYSGSTEERNIANAESPESIDDTNVEVIPTDDKIDTIEKLGNKDDIQRTNEERIGENSEKTDIILETLQTQEEHKTDGLELQPKACELNSSDLYRSEVVIIETDEDNKSVEWLNDPRNSTDPLDVCMYAIKNLYESLKVKENELLKLSAMQSDQKQIEALQAVVIDFHKDITNLNIELEHSKKENMLLKEQVLELEEAENDARLVAQTLEQKLLFLQEKDSHSQAELTQLKQNIKKSIETLVEKEKVEKELRSQIKYTDILVQKYEDQIKTMEAKELEASKIIKPNVPMKCDHEIQVKPDTCTKGTQMYIFTQSKINQITSNNNVNTADDRNSFSESQNIEISEDSRTTFCESAVKTDTSICSFDLISVNEPAYCSEQADIVNLENIENISQKGLLKRLHKLIDEDVNLQQQIHYVDEINLAMWKKLQNLDNHIGECKRQNINETNPVFSESEIISPGEEKREIQNQEQTSMNSNKNIPIHFSVSLEKNENDIQERLNMLKEINAAFEKELKDRENLCKDKKKNIEGWVETEKLVINEINRLDEEKNWIINQINNLQKEMEVREKLTFQLEQKIVYLKNKHQEELVIIRGEQVKMAEPLILKINHMLTKEKDILKLISNFKLKENRSEGKNELERLKCNYIELQLELSQAREEIRNIEEKFKYLLDKCIEKLLSEETQRTQELECVRKQNARCIKMIKDLEENKNDLINALKKQEKYLQEIRENYQKNTDETEGEHRSTETELESQLRLIEEGASIATTVLKEERLKAEKELQESIKDLRAKEGVYKAKIAELERDVTNLHEELHKITADEMKDLNDDVQIQEKISDEIIEKSIEILSSKSETSEIAPLKRPRSIIDGYTKSLIEPVKHLNLQTTTDERPTDFEIKQINNEEKSVEEDVNELRAQVRELQSHIEKISEEVAELPNIQTAKSITASSLNMQKEDIDYAEVDECCSEAIKKQNSPNINPNRSKHESFYEKTHTPEANNALKVQKATEESTEENDYDEVLPRPTNFHVVQQVGADTLLVGWNYVNPIVLDGFEIHLDDEVHERIYIPDRTKALISGLNLRKPLRLSIYALSRYGQLSEPSVLEISPQPRPNTNYFDDEEDEYRDFEDPMNPNKRPYSMEW